MKKVLIYTDYALKARAGGPATYLYGLREGLQKLEDSIVEFSDFKPVHGKEAEKAYVQTIRDLARSFIPKDIRENLRLRSSLGSINTTSVVKKDLDRYQLIHFHTTHSLYKCLNQLDSYKGSVWLTMHSPKAPHLEFIEDTHKMQIQHVWKSSLNFTEAIDIAAIERADVLLFPTESAMEPYFSTWPKFGDLVKGKKVVQCPSGIIEPQVRISRENVRKKLGIGSSDIVFCYAGRHNQVKGYDLLLKAGQDLLNRYSDLKFVVMGKEDPLYGLDHPGWIELGWTDDPHSIMAASDCYVLPNRQTYFDLVTLEAMALDLPIVLSRTGGNRYFEELDASIFFHEPNDDESLIQAIETVYRGLADPSLLQSNRSIFISSFTAEAFARRYLKAISTSTIPL